jgi:hypothetical protein
MIVRFVDGLLRFWTVLFSFVLLYWRSKALSTSPSSSSRWVSRTLLGRSEAADVLNRDLLPQADYGRRISLGNEAQSVQEGVLTANDILDSAYGEFPLESADLLLDRAGRYLEEGEEDSRVSAATAADRRRTVVVDIGSGCGRLILYWVLSRPDWDVHGIEMEPIFHQQAVEAVERAVRGGWLSRETGRDDGSGFVSRLSPHLGPADEFGSVLEKADVCFCYSTAMSGPDFSPAAGTAVLGRQWNELLTEHCRNSIVVTTDKALDPALGWEVLERIDVSNPEVFESTGYIQRWKG